MRTFFSIFIIAILMGGFIFLFVREDRLTKEFYEMKINSLVTKSSDWQKRSIDFYLANGVVLNFVVPIEDKLKLGDSISKKSNTYLYKVYRKDTEDVYVYFTEYSYKTSK